jgi:predicted RNA-binding protein with PIN domain
VKPLLYVDGYNVIGAWPKAAQEKWPLDECRDRLIHLLEDYAGYSGQEVWVVFDGYKADRTHRSVENRPDLTIVYTRHGETADHFIERMCQQLPKYREARVATSDGIEQTIILGRGATRMSARELWRELNAERSSGRDRHQMPSAQQRTALAAALSAEQYAALDKLRRQK